MTRIIGVLPRPVRWALAALALLGSLLAGASALLAVRARRLRREGRRLAADVQLLEATLVPAVPAQVGMASVSAAHRAVDALAAGGDFYDAFELGDGRTGLVMGDVEGHGRPAVPLTATVRYSLRAYLEAGLAPRTALSVAAAALARELGEHLVTAVVAVYDGTRGSLTYACAGHPAPLLIGVSADTPTVGTSPPIGAGMATGRRQVTVPLPPGTAAVFYTDGAIDPRLDRSREASSRLADAVAGRRGEVDAEELLGHLLQSTEQPDDTSACILRPLPHAAAGSREHVEEIEFDAQELARAGERFLSACHVPARDITAAMARARPIADRSGTAVVTIRRGESAVAVSVEPAAEARFAVDARAPDGARPAPTPAR